MSDCLVDAIDIGRDFPDGKNNFVTVLQSVRCRIQARDRIALTGPSGSGKSTLLHILGGLDEPSEGSVTWPALGPRESLRPEKVAYVFQTQSLFPALTVLENVALPMVMIDREKEGDLRATAILEAFELDNLATKLPEELSGGQAQRIALARALVTQPKLILADEPTGQLDGVTAQAVMGTLLHLIERTQTALMVATHDPRIVDRLKNVWAIQHGHLSTDTPCSQSGAKSQ